MVYQMKRAVGTAPGRAPTLPGVDASSQADGLVALGRPGEEGYVGLEAFPNPGVARVELTSDELVAVCPLTRRTDLYVAAIAYEPERLCLESKSLRLYLSRFRDEEHFCEALAVRIRDDVAAALELPAGRVRVTLTQKARGGIAISATA